MENNKLTTKQILLIILLVLFILLGIFGVLCGGTFLIYMTSYEYYRLSNLLFYPIVIFGFYLIYLILKYGFGLILYIINNGITIKDLLGKILKFIGWLSLFFVGVGLLVFGGIILFEDNYYKDKFFGIFLIITGLISLYLIYNKLNGKMGLFYK